MLINDNGITRETTKEEEEAWKKISKPTPVVDAEQKAEAYDYLTGRSAADE